MGTTTDFESWFLSGNKPANGDIEEIYNLYQATLGESSGMYKSRRQGVTIVISGPGVGDDLALVSEKAVFLFQKFVTEMNPYDDMDLAGALQYHRSMKKQD